MSKLKGKGLKEYNIIKSFGEMIWGTIKITAEEKQSSKWPYNPLEIVQMLDKRPFPEIYSKFLYRSWEICN